jgi:hypothetical protein
MSEVEYMFAELVRWFGDRARVLLAWLVDIFYFLYDNPGVVWAICVVAVALVAIIFGGAKIRESVSVYLEQMRQRALEEAAAVEAETAKWSELVPHFFRYVDEEMGNVCYRLYNSSELSCVPMTGEEGK